VHDRTGGRTVWRTLSIPANGPRDRQVFVRGKPEPRFCIAESSLLLKARARFFSGCFGWRGCMSEDGRSGVSGNGLGAPGTHPRAVRWARSSSKRIITTPPSFARKPHSGWGDRPGLAHIVRKPQTMQASWGQAIVTVRRFFYVVSAGGSALRTGQVPYPKTHERDTEFLAQVCHGSCRYSRELKRLSAARREPEARIESCR
jgi:hypothetical protein